MIGFTISHYTITKKLSDGEMDVLYKARDTKLRKTVTPKFLRTGSLESNGRNQGFLRRARTAVLLDRASVKRSTPRVGRAAAEYRLAAWLASYLSVPRSG